LFASVEQVRDDLAGVKHCISFGTVPEEEAFKQDDLKDGTCGESDVYKYFRGYLPPGVGRRNYERGEDNPKGDGDDQQGTLGNEEEDSRHSDSVLGNFWLENGKQGTRRGLGPSVGDRNRFWSRGSVCRVPRGSGRTMGGYVGFWYGIGSY